jgi:alkylation response protein AidB-like acyl-CoA dehydrogenase
MDFEFTDEQHELRATVRAVLARECPISLVREVVEKGWGATTGPDQLWGRLVELDWTALTVPEPFGGMGLGFVELAIVCEELGRVVAPGPYLATVTQFAPAVRAAGTPEQQQAFLAAVASGGVTGTLAVAEESGSWDPASVRATARRDGGGWVLSGTKHWVLDGARADEVVVAARVDEGDGIGLFVVPGAELPAAPVAALDPTLPLATLDLDGVRVPDERALGAPGSCGPPLTRALEEAVTAFALSTLGTCEAIVEATVEYAKVREQFGVPIGSFQAVKHKLSDMHVAVERARVTCEFAALTIAEDDERRTLATSMAKAAAGECQRLVAQDGLQLHGGIGYTWEHDLHLYLKRAKTGDALFGTAATHRARVAALSGLAS